MKTIAGADPDRRGAVFEKIGDHFGIRSSGGKVSLELRLSVGRERVEARYAVRGCDPVITAARDEQIVNHSMRQALRDAVVYEFITIEARQAVLSAKPQEATRIWNDLEDAITREAVSGCIGANRKLFRALLRTRNENEYSDGDRSLHGAAMINVE